jgi:hypothetical protein
MPTPSGYIAAYIAELGGIGGALGGSLIGGAGGFAALPLSLGARTSVIGDSIYSAARRSTYWSQVNSRGIGYYPLNSNQAISGTRLSGSSPSIDADFFTNIGTSRPSIIEANGGTNDLINGVSDTTIMAAWQSIIAKCASIGANLTICPILPRQAPNALTGPQETFRLSVNAQLAAINLPHVAVCDISAFSSANTLDGLHPDEVGSLQLAPGRLTALNKFLPSGNILSLTNSDVNNVVAASGFFAGSGGSVANGATGTVATNWTLDAFHTGTGPTCAGSVIVNPAGGNWQQIVIGGTSPSDGTAFNPQLKLNFITLGSNFASGTWFEPVYEFEVDAGSVGFYGHDFSVTLTQPAFAGGSGSCGGFAGTGALNSANVATAYTGARRSFPGQSTNVTGIVSGQVGFPFVALGNGVPIALTIRIGRVGIRAIPNPTCPFGP